MTGEEVFLRGLYELVSGDNQERICLNVFGREYSIQSRAYTFFITHIHANFEHHLLKIKLDCFYQNTFLKKVQLLSKRKWIAVSAAIWCFYLPIFVVQTLV